MPLLWRDISYFFKPSKVEGVCDKCGGELYQRDDDKVETVEKRLSVYAAQTKPLIDYYKNSNLYIEVDGKQGMDAVFDDIVRASKRVNNYDYFKV